VADPQRDRSDSTPAWHPLTPEEALQRQESTPRGLDPAEVERRRERYGPNVLPGKEPPTLLTIVLHQFANPLIYVLLAAAAVSLLIGEMKDAVFILLVIVLNAVIGTSQEWKAESSAAALQKMMTIQVRVRRGDSDHTIDAEELVPGDIVLLESGNKVPADLRLLEVRNLEMDESFLTGESQVVTKSTQALDEDTGLGDRLNIAFAGATTTSGRGVGLVVATGAATEVGRIARSVAEGESSKPPLLIRMERFAHQISYIVLGASAVLAVIAVGQGIPWLEVFFLAVALAVSAIPEGLPVALTVALSIATSRMAKRNVIVRRLTAVESLGSCQVIASDKTGTLTVNQQTVKAVLLPSGERFTVTGEGYAGEGEVRAAGEDTSLEPPAQDRLVRLARAAVLCNEGDLERDGKGWRHGGDAMDVALLALGYKLDLPPRDVRAGVELLGAIPFESERRYAARAYRTGGNGSGGDGGTIVAVKGAVETVLPLCRNMAGPDCPIELDAGGIERAALELADGGHRVLAVAEGPLDSGPDGEELNEETLPPLTLLGLVGFIDPLRPEAKDAVAECRGAGVDVIMITGDHPATARAIARELGITDGEDDVVTGEQLASLGEPGGPDYRDAVARHHVFARVSPLQKLDIVESLVDGGRFVAVTGDGVNDAPALRRANIGVAMGSGTDVAKDTADMIVTDDNFASIVAGIEEGRFAYDNVRKVTYLLIATGAAEVLLFTLALLSGLPLPLFAVQILWLNLVTNGIQDVALAFEGGEPGAMQRPPRRPTEGIFDGLMVQQTVVSGLVMSLITFGLWAWMIGTGREEETSRNLLLLLMVLLQNVHVFNCRSEYVSAFRVPLRRNYILVFGVLAAQGLHILAMQVPFAQDLLQVAPISPREWGYLLLLALPILLAMEAFKAVRLRRSREAAMRRGG
jgi:P-type Ca2+ transporter type 2C